MEIAARIPHPPLRGTFPPGEGIGAVGNCQQLSITNYKLQIEVWAEPRGLEKRPPLTRGLLSATKLGERKNDGYYSLPPSCLAASHLPRQREALWGAVGNCQLSIINCSILRTTTPQSEIGDF